jgi:hypothetical protein
MTGATPGTEIELKRIALAAAGAAVVGLTACSHTAAPAASPASHGSVSATKVPVSCSQQYHTWKYGHGKGVIAALHAVSAAGAAGDSQALTVALKKAGPVVAKAAHHPIPACADPRGYWDVLLMHVNAAVVSKHSPSSVRAAMKAVPKIERELTVEVKNMPGQ